MSGSISSAFSDAPVESAHIFRTILDAMARPGKIYAVEYRGSAVSPLGRATTATILALADHESPIWLDQDINGDEITRFIRFHCGAPIVASPLVAAFAVCSSCPSVAVLSELSIGDAQYPDRSATLVIQVESLSSDGNIILSGPGIKKKQCLHAEGLSREFWQWLAQNGVRFPLGVDVILACENQLVALPRSVKILETV